MIKISNRSCGLVLDTALAFLAFVGSLHIHMGGALWSIPSEVLLKYSLVLALLFLGLSLWTSIPHLRHIHGKTLVIFALFVASVHVLYWPCSVLMGRYYPLPTLMLGTSSCLLFFMLVGWRLLAQLSQPMMRSHVET